MAFVVFTGQSNAGGFGVDASSLRTPWTPDPLTLIWDAAAKAWVQFQPGTNTGYGQQPNAWGPEVEFARQFRAEHPGEELRIVKVAHGGSSLAIDPVAWHYDWSPDSRDEYFDMVTRTIADAAAPLGGIRPAFVFWGQGEEDARYQGAASVYGENLTKLFAAMRQHWLADPAGKIGYFRIVISPPFADTVRAAQLAVDAADPNARSFDTYLYPTQSDSLHLSAYSYDRVGLDAYQAYADFRAGRAPQPGVSNTGGEGADQMAGSIGDDTLAGAAGDDAVRGGEGADLLMGNAGADDIEGRQGLDILFGGAGSDWLSGGRDEDRLYGEDGADLLLGAHGRDIIDAGAGNDVLRGGSGDDVLYGREGDDFLSGDRGDDVLFGGAGADRFYVAAGAGVDLVMDFNRAQGDRVQLAPGSSWTVAQVGADTVVSLDGGAKVILAGVSLASLGVDWIGI